MTHNEMIAVIEAYQEGKTIQAIARPGEPGHALGWKDVIPNWDFYRCEFRIKPKSREWWIQPFGEGYPQPETILVRVLTDKPKDPAWVHVREVLP
jgi:hypothetical protein